MKFKDYMKEARIPKENEVGEDGVEKGSKSIFSKLKKKEPSPEEKADKLKQSRIEDEEERNLNKALAAGLDVKIPGVETEEKQSPFGGKGGGVELSGNKDSKDSKDSKDGEDGEDEKDKKEDGEKKENPFAKKDDKDDKDDKSDSKDSDDSEECEDDDEECKKKKEEKEKKLKEDIYYINDEIDFFSLI
jgi:hypothetical protein